MPTWQRCLIAWFFVPVHGFLFRLSGGRLLGRLEGTEVLILVTKGRKSGKQRISPLLYFRFEEAGDLVIVASNYGLDHHPAWYLNVVADPNVVVEVRGERFSAMARVVRGDDRTALFDRWLQQTRVSPPIAPAPSARSPSSCSAAPIQEPDTVSGKRARAPSRAECSGCSAGAPTQSSPASGSHDDSSHPGGQRVKHADATASGVAPGG